MAPIHSPTQPTLPQHSIYVLRLFNDCVAMLFVFSSVLLLQTQHYVWGTTLLSAAISVKMNALLLVPGLLLVLIKTCSLPKQMAAVGAACGLQIALALPFLTSPHHARHYVARAFEFSRQFTYVWTVNLKFVPEAWFKSKVLAGGLLACHLALLFALAECKWCRRQAGEGEGKGEGKREEGKGQRRGVGGVHEGGALGLAGAWLAQVGQAALRVVGVDITTAWLERGRRALALGGAPPAFVAHVLFGW